MELKDLQGKATLSAVDLGSIRVPDRYENDGRTFHDCDACYFRLNGTLYAAVEDQNDGYRSSMRELYIDPHTNVINEFPEVAVFCIHHSGGDECSYDSHDLLSIYDLETSKLVLRVGTRNADDYYPSFVARFDPTAMSINNGVEG